VTELSPSQKPFSEDALSRSRFRTLQHLEEISQVHALAGFRRNAKIIIITVTANCLKCFYPTDPALVEILPVQSRAVGGYVTASHCTGTPSAAPHGLPRKDSDCSYPAAASSWWLGAELALGMIRFNEI
jgi:hypothetical protein